MVKYIYKNGCPKSTKNKILGYSCPDEQNFRVAYQCYGANAEDVYEYSIKKCTQEEISQMQQFAREGEGLDIMLDRINQEERYDNVYKHIKALIKDVTY